MEESPDNQAFVERIAQLEHNVRWLNAQKEELDQQLAYLVRTVKQLATDQTIKSQLDTIQKKFANGEPFR